MTYPQGENPGHTYHTSSTGAVPLSDLTRQTQDALASYNGQYLEDPLEYWRRLAGHIRAYSPEGISQARVFVHAEEPDDSETDVMVIHPDRQMMPLRADFVRHNLESAEVIGKDERPLSVIEYIEPSSITNSAAIIADILERIGYQRVHLAGIGWIGSAAINYLYNFDALTEESGVVSGLHIDDIAHINRGRAAFQRLRRARRPASVDPWSRWAQDGPVAYTNAMDNLLVADNIDTTFKIPNGAASTLRKDLLRRTGNFVLGTEISLTIAYTAGSYGGSMDDFLARQVSRKLAEMKMLQTLQVEGSGGWTNHHLMIADICLRSVLHAQDVEAKRNQGF